MESSTNHGAIDNKRVMAAFDIEMTYRLCSQVQALQADRKARVYRMHVGKDCMCNTDNYCLYNLKVWVHWRGHLCEYVLHR